MAEYLMPGDEIRPAIQTFRDLRTLIRLAAEVPETRVYVRLVDDHGRDQGDTEIMAVVQDTDGAIRLVVPR